MGRESCTPSARSAHRGLWVPLVAHFDELGDSGSLPRQLAPAALRYRRCVGMITRDMAITQLDCFRATVRHQAHEGVLAHASYTPDLARRLREHLGIGPEGEISRALGLYTPVMVQPTSTATVFERDFARYYTDIDIPEGSRINAMGTLCIPAGFYHFDSMVSPLRNAASLDEIRDFPYPVHHGNDEPRMAADVADAHAQGRVVAGMIGHIFENAWQIRGLEPFLMDMIAAPENCEHIFGRLHEYQKARALAEARAGVDYLHTGDDVATQQTMMFGVDLWRRFIKPLWADIYASAKAIKPDLKVWYHSDGNIIEIIPELIEIGVDILNPIQPECLDPFTVGQRWGDRVVLDGCIGTQSVMPFGTADEVRDTVRRLVDGLGGTGGLMLAPTHVLEPDVPIENVIAYAEAAREYGDVV